MDPKMTTFGDLLSADALGAILTKTKPMAAGFREDGSLAVVSATGQKYIFTPAQVQQARDRMTIPAQVVKEANNPSPKGEAGEARGRGLPTADITHLDQPDPRQVKPGPGKPTAPHKTAAGPRKK
jgi:hypothetical protein